MLCPPLRIRDQKTIDAVEAPWLTPPEKAKIVTSAGKVITSVFWNAKGIVFIKYIQKGRTINGKYYANLLSCEKQSRQLAKEVLFHQDNAPAHKSVVAMAVVRDCGFTRVDHPPYLPDLAPSDYFSKHEKAPSWEALQIRRGGKSCCEGVFWDQNEGFYTTAIQRAPALPEKVCGSKGRLW